MRPLGVIVVVDELLQQSIEVPSTGNNDVIRKLSP